MMLRYHLSFFEKTIAIVRYLCYYIQVPYYHEEDAIWS